MMTTKTTLERWHAAYHEAGHAAIATVLGVRVLRASVNLSGGGITEYVTSFENAADLQTRITTLAAGWSAEKEASPGHKNPFGWSGDYESIAAVLESKFGSSRPVSESTLARVYCCYSRVLVRKYWDRIRQVAEYVFGHDKIDGENIKDIMEGAPKPSLEDHQRALEMADTLDWGKK